MGSQWPSRRSEGSPGGNRSGAWNPIATEPNEASSPGAAVSTGRGGGGTRISPCGPLGATKLGGASLGIGAHAVEACGTFGDANRKELHVHHPEARGGRRTIAMMRCGSARHARTGGGCNQGCSGSGSTMPSSINSGNSRRRRAPPLLNRRRGGHAPEEQGFGRGSSRGITNWICVQLDLRMGWPRPSPCRP